jgi:hypothetical protein
MGDLPINQWVYIENFERGKMFAASTKKYGEDHVVEAGYHSFTNEDKCRWRLHMVDGHCYIENKLRGFMFAASTDKKDNDHVVECNPSVNTLEAAVNAGFKKDKWKWIITREESGFRIQNMAYGALFAASTDKDGHDHIVETNPQDAHNSKKKYFWNLLIITE